MNKRFDGMGRAELERIAADAFERIERLERHNRELNDNLTAVQTRCTELKLELREARKGIVLPGWSCCVCGCFNGEEKEELTNCRNCGYGKSVQK